MIIQGKLTVFEENLEILLIHCISKTPYNSEDKISLQKWENEFKIAYTYVK